MAGRAGHRGFGRIRRLPSKRYQASYVGLDGVRHVAPSTFEAKQDAERWLSAEHALLAADEWRPPTARKAAKVATFGEYAEKWMTRRELKPRTREHYRSLLDRQLLPHLGDVPLKSLDSEKVRDWYADLDPTRPTLRAHAYGLLRTILHTAVDDEKITINPCRIRAAGTTRRVVKVKPATLTELESIAAAMPGKYRALLLISAWCALRFGEATELRRRDLDLKNGVIRVRRGVVRAGGNVLIGDPKSAAGSRDIAIPPHLLPMLRDHLDAMPMRGRDALIFPAADGTSHLAPATLYGVFYPARQAAGRPDLRWHDLRHTGAVLAAQTGATLAELMGRLGHSTPQAALRYQHAAQGRDAEIARRLSAMVDAST